MVSGKFFQYCLVVPPGIPSERLCRFPLRPGGRLLLSSDGPGSAEQGGWASAGDAGGFWWDVARGGGVPGVVMTSYVRSKRSGGTGRKGETGYKVCSKLSGSHEGKKRKSVGFCRLPDLDTGYPGKIAIVGRDC